MNGTTSPFGIIINVVEGRRGLVGLFVNNKFIRRQGSMVRIPGLLLLFL